MVKAIDIVGGTGINASTGNEMTQYYVTLPKNKLELYLALEADRLANPVFREFYSERDVITEERRMSENSPGFFFQEQLNATFYAASPYCWEVVGWMSDISRVTKQEMIEYREQFYRPDNATLVLAGDLDPAEVCRSSRSTSGRSSRRGSRRASGPRSRRPSSTGGRSGRTSSRPTSRSGSSAAPPTNPNVTVMFHIPPLWHDDLAPLYMLGQRDERADRQDVPRHGPEERHRDARDGDGLELDVRRRRSA